MSSRGASNLTRGFQTVVSTARAVWGRDVEVLLDGFSPEQTLAWVAEALHRLRRVTDDTS